MRRAPNAAIAAEKPKAVRSSPHGRSLGYLSPGPRTKDDHWVNRGEIKKETMVLTCFLPSNIRRINSLKIDINLLVAG